MKRSKRLFCMLMVLCMVMMLLPVTTSAEQLPITIGTTGYATITEALAAAVNGDLIVLHDNITESVVYTSTADINITIDGQGYTITGASDIESVALKLDGSGVVKLRSLTLQGGSADSHSFGMMVSGSVGVQSEGTVKAFGASPNSGGSAGLQHSGSGVVNITEAIGGSTTGSLFGSIGVENSAAGTVNVVNATAGASYTVSYAVTNTGAGTVNVTNAVASSAKSSIGVYNRSTGTTNVNDARSGNTQSVNNTDSSFGVYCSGGGTINVNNTTCGTGYRYAATENVGGTVNAGTIVGPAEGPRNTGSDAATLTLSKASGAGCVLDTITVAASGDTIVGTLPDVTKNGVTGSWYSDMDLTIPFTGTTVSGATTLYSSAFINNTAPSVISGQATQTGSATPASNNGGVPAAAYAGYADNWFIDPEGNTLTYSVVSAVDESSNDVTANVAISGGMVVYTPATTQAGLTVTIEVKANDGTVDSTGNVTITVSVGAVPEDDNAPEVVPGQESQTGSATPASNDGHTAAVAYTHDVSTWFSDSDPGDTLTYGVVSATDGSNGNLTADVAISGSTITYAPKAAQAGKTVTIKVKANDGKTDSTGSVTITVSVGSLPGDNDSPWVNSGQATQTGSATPASNDGNTAAVAYSAAVSDWFFDWEYDTLTYSVVSAQCGTDLDGYADVSSDVSVSEAESDGRMMITYTPKAAQAGKTIIIIVKANDGKSDSTGNVTITVSVGAVPADISVNHAPEVVAGQGTQTGSAAAAAIDGSIAAVPYTADVSNWFTDPDGDTLTYALQSAIDNSNINVSEDVLISGNTITYTPKKAQIAKNVIITVKAYDGNLYSSGNITITVSVAKDASGYNAAITAIPADNDSSLYTSGSWTAFKTAIAACSLTLTLADGQMSLDAEERKIYKAIDLLAPVNAVSLIPDGTASLSNTFSSMTDVKWFSFYATAGKTYTIQTSNLFGSNISMDTVLHLYAPDSLTRLDFNDDISSSDCASAITYTVSTSGTYYLKVEHFVYYNYLNNSGSMAYQSNAGRFDIEVSQNTNASLTATPVISGAAVEGDTCVVGTAVANAIIVLRINGMPKATVLVEGGVWAVNVNALAQGDVISVTAETYPDAVSQAATETAGAGGPVVFVPSTDNSLANNAAVIGVTGTTAQSSNTAVATVAIDNGRIAITSVHAGKATITISDDGGHKAVLTIGVLNTGEILFGVLTKGINPITDSSTANDIPTLGFIGTSAVSSNTSVVTAAIVDGRIAVTSVNQGTATVTVTDAGSNIATLDVLVTAEGLIKIIGYNDVPEKAVSISTDGITLTNRIHPVTDVDWFKFDVLAGQTYSIKTSNLLPSIIYSNAMDTVMFLYDTDMATQLDFNDDSIGIASGIDFTAPSTGTYYLKVEHFNYYDYQRSGTTLQTYNIGRYDISVNIDSSALPAATPVIAGPVSGGDTIVSGTAVDGATVVLRINGNPVKPSVTVTNGIWSFSGLTLTQGDRISATAVSDSNVISLAAILTVGAPAEFMAATDNSTENNEATLGIAGASLVSSDTGVATAVIAGGKIAITSVGAGIAAITVTDAASHSAIIPVVVAGNGAIIKGTIVKYISILTPATDSSTANDTATLGITGTTVESSNTGVATAAIAGGKIAITSVGAGTAVITITDAASHSAAIAVTVAITGAITIKSITKYTASGTVISGGGFLPKTQETPDISNSGDGTISSVTIPSTPDNSTGLAKAAVKADVVTSLVDSAKKAEASGAHAIVEIKVDAVTQTKAMEVVIPRSSFNDIAGSTNADLQISTGIGTLTLDAKAVESISGAAAGDIMISVAKVDASTLSDVVKQAVGDRPVYNFSVKAGDTEISTFGGGGVKISLPYTPKAGEDVNAVVVYYIDASGKLQAMQGAYDAVTGTVNFVTSHFSKYMIGYNKVSFNDVTATDWFSEAVTFIAARGITTGAGNGNYNPDGKLTRGQFITMAMRAYGINPDENSKNNFADAGNTYYTGYLAAAKRLGITAGTGNNMFAPEKEITRQEMFTLLYNVLKSAGELPQGTAGKALSSFDDANQVASWAKDAMTLFVKTGTISGSGGKLAPASTTTRAEMAQVLYNLLAK